MTRAEALAEAQKRWGLEAWVSSHKARKGRTPRHYEVGASRFNLSVIGSGDSWEAAFADADKRAEFRKMNDIGNAHFNIGPGRMV